MSRKRPLNAGKKEGVRFVPKEKNASVEKLKEIMETIKLTQPVDLRELKEK